MPIFGCRQTSKHLDFMSYEGPQMSFDVTAVRLLTYQFQKISFLQNLNFCEELLKGESCLRIRYRLSTLTNFWGLICAPFNYKANFLNFGAQIKVRRHFLPQSQEWQILKKQEVGLSSNSRLTLGSYQGWSFALTLMILGE